RPLKVRENMNLRNLGVVRQRFGDFLRRHSRSQQAVADLLVPPGSPAALESKAHTHDLLRWAGWIWLFPGRVQKRHQAREAWVVGGAEPQAAAMSECLRRMRQPLQIRGKK